MKKKIIIIIAIVVLIIFSLLIIELNKGKKEERQSEEVEKLGYNVNIEESKKELEKELNEVENKYQEEKGNYERDDIYNSLLSMNNNTNNYIEIVDLGDINFNAEKYNSQLEKIEELPEVNEKLSNRYNLEEGNYYLIRYQSMENSNYMIYYIGQLKKDGLKDLKFYCITTGEYISYGM